MNSTYYHRKDETGTCYIQNMQKCTAVHPIRKEIVRQRAKALDLPCSEEEVEAIAEIIENILPSFERIDSLPDPFPRVKYSRTPGYRPQPENNPCNAWYYRCDIKGAATGKLVGKRVGIKDNTAVAGVPMMNGSKIMEGYVPEYDATVVTRILDAGGHILGKTMCDDLCFSSGGFNSSTGPVSNPFRKHHLAGGSSSGNAALLAVGEIDMAVGGDQGGSIRIPAAWCGVVGFKPTHGLVPYTGSMSAVPCIDHLGPMTRTVHECALLLEVIAGYDGGRDPRQKLDRTVPQYTSLLTTNLTGKRIAVVKEGFQGCEPDMARVVHEAAQKLTEAGAEVKEISVPIHKDGIHIFAPLTTETAYQVLVRDKGALVGFKGTTFLSMMNKFADGQNARPFDFPEAMRPYLILGKYMTTSYKGRFYAKAQNLVCHLTAEYNKVLEDYDVMIMPTTLNYPPCVVGHDSKVADRLSAVSSNTRNTAPFNATGHPSLSINAGEAGGFPVGMMIIGNHFDEVSVLQVAYAFEHLRDNVTTNRRA